jgi:hypothetical protein
VAKATKITEEKLMLPVSKIKPLPNNPHKISKAKLELLAQSLRECPHLLSARPVICSDRTGEIIALGGNKRWMAAPKAGMSEVPVHLYHGLTEDQEREIAIKDNGQWGEWDFDLLANFGTIPPSWGVEIFSEVEQDSVLSEIAEWDGSPLKGTSLFVFKADVSMQAKIRAILRRELPGLKFTEEVIFDEA